MANGHGGKRTPRQPAPASPPGALSRRTDGGPQQVNAQMTGMAYGENSDFQDIQRSAPMSASAPRQSRGSRSKAGSGVAPLFSKTQRPNEPVTQGSDVGPGDPYSYPPNDRDQAKADAQMLNKYLPDLMRMAESPDTPDGFKRFVRYLRNMQG